MRRDLERPRGLHHTIGGDHLASAGARQEAVWYQYGIGGVERGKVKGATGSGDDTDANQHPNLKVAPSIRMNVRSEVSPLAVFVTIMRSWRSAHAPATGPPNTNGIVKPRLRSVKARANSALCLGAE